MFLSAGRAKGPPVNKRPPMLGDADLDEQRRPKTPRSNSHCREYVIVSDASPDLHAPLQLLHSEESLGHTVRVYAPAGTNEKYFHMPAAIAVCMLKNVLDIDKLSTGYADQIRSDECTDVAISQSTGEAVVFASRPYFEEKTAKFAAMLACRRTIAARVVEAFSARHVFSAAGGAWSQEGVNNTTRSLAGGYLAHYPDTDTLSSVSLIKAGALITQNRSATAAAQGFLSRVVSLVNYKREKPLISGVVSLGVFTAASLIAAHPLDSFEEQGEVEMELISRSMSLVPRMAEVAGALHAGVLWGVAQAASRGKPSLSSMLCRFLMAFKKWKVGDETRLASRIELALDALASERAGLNNDENGSLLESIDEKTAELRHKLSMLSIKRPPPPGTGQHRTAARVSNVDYEGQPPTSGANKKLPEGIGGLSNEQIAHELMINPKFRITDDTVTGDHLVAMRMHKVFERAFTSSLVADLTEQPPRYGRVISMLQEFRSSLNMLASTRAVRDEVGRVLDIEGIKETVEKGGMGVAARQELLRELADLVCKVHRGIEGDMAAKATREALDAADQALGGARGVQDVARLTCEYLEVAQTCIYAARMDLGNQKLRGVAVVVGERGVEYARCNFRKRLESGEISLDNTIEWLCDSVANLDSDPGADISAAKLLEGSPDDFKRMLQLATVDMIVSGREALPETYRFDGLRIKALGQHLEADVRAFSILSSVHSMTGLRSPAHTEAALAAASEVLTAPRRPSMCMDTVLEDVRKGIAGAGVGERELGDIMRVVGKNVDPASAVSSAAAKIVRRAWLGILRDGHFPTDIKFASAAHSMRDGMVQRCAPMGRMIDVSKEVFVHEYNDIIMDAARLACSR